MERTQVADFYRGKGYQVHESIVVTGQSGNQQRVPLLCEGPLGNLAVFFGDAAGIDGPEIGAAKRVARDLGATAVVAAGSFSGEQRAQAAELGVVLLDASAIGAAPQRPSIDSAWPGQTPRQSLERDLEAHPWPASGRPGGLDATREAALVDIDEVAARPPASQAAPPTRATALVPGLATPAPAPTRTDAGGLWKHPRAATAAPAASPAPARASPATAGRFAWLDLPKAQPAAAELEVDVAVSARPAAKPPTPEELAAQERARLEREVLLRMYVRRGAWVLGGAVAVYLFLLWWF